MMMKALTYNLKHSTIGHKLRSCGKKKKYNSKKLAIKVAIKCNIQRSANINSIYFCNFCENYHIGHKSITAIKLSLPYATYWIRGDINDRFK